MSKQPIIQVHSCRACKYVKVKLRISHELNERLIMNVIRLKL